MAARSFVRLTCGWALVAAGIFVAAGQAKATGFDIVPSYSASFPESLKPAVEHATQLWEGWITNTGWGGDASTVEITFNWQSLGEGTLGTAMICWWGHAAGFAMTPAQYMFGTGIDSQGQDGVITFNSDQPWYAGTDGDPPPTEWDVVTVTLHEIGHQLGMMPSYNYVVGTWGYMEGLLGDWHLTRWDTYLRDQDGDAPAPWPDPESFDETGEVTLVSPTSAMFNQGNPVPIYAPDPFEPASSLSHVYQTGDEDALMWLSISSGASRHGLYDYEAGIFIDLAWGFHRMFEVHATGVRNRSWHHGAAWAGGLPPADGAAVYLDAAVSSAYYVNLRKDASAASLVVSGRGRLDVQVGTLTVSGATSVQGADAQIAVKDGTGLHTAELTIQDGLVWISGGTVEVTTACAVDGQLQLTGGRLSAAELCVGHGGAGTLRIDDPGADITVSGKLSFGPDSSLIAAGGAAIQMTGSGLENHSTDPTALAGLENLTLIFEGGSGSVDDLEVAGEDLGPILAGWANNFALGALQLGGADVGRVRLVNDAENHQPPCPEALYVSSLVVNPGATINFNDLNLYFLSDGQPRQLFGGDANLDGRVDGLDYNAWSLHYLGSAGWCEGDFNDDLTADGLDYNIWSLNYQMGSGAAGQVPEPCCGLLLVAGVCAVRRRRRGA